MLPSPKAYIIAVTMQALVTGVYLASFLVCVRWLAFSDDGSGTIRRRINRPLLIITITLFAFSVTDLALSIQATLLTFHGTSALIYATTTPFLEIMTAIINDGTLIFRCWAVCNKSWRIVALPLVLFLYSISCLLMLTYWNVVDALTKKEHGPIHTAILGSYFATTIVINVYATSVIIFQIRRNSLSRNLSRFAIRVIAESGLLYTLTSIVVFCTVLLSPVIGQVVATAINFPMSGIAYNLILIRVAQNRAKPQGLPTIIGDSSFERIIPTETRHSSNPEVVASLEKGL